VAPFNRQGDDGGREGLWLHRRVVVSARGGRREEGGPSTTLVGGSGANEAPQTCRGGESGMGTMEMVEERC
jgi:hypothetical protein